MSGSLEKESRTFTASLSRNMQVAIRVNNASQRMVGTLTTSAYGDVSLRPIAANTSLKRLSEPRNFGDVVIWLCSDEARFVQGQSIVVDGGCYIAGAH